MTGTDDAAASSPPAAGSVPSESAGSVRPESPAIPATPPTEADSAPPAPDAAPVDLTKPQSAAPRGGAHRAAPASRFAGSRWAAYRLRRREKKAAKARKPHRKAPWWELPALVVLAVLIAILVKTFIVQPFYIPSASMEKTLAGSKELGHDRILVNKLVYDFRDPHPGDIVVFHAPPGWNNEPTSKPPSNPVLRVIRGFGQLVGVVPPDGEVLVKRVIATGGQTVKGDSAGHVMVSKKGPDGPYRTLNEPYVFVDPGQGNSQRPFGPVTVPKGRLWVMGDHRNDSADSRYHCGVGGIDSANDTNCDAKASTVPVDDVIGKAFIVAWPPSHWRTLGTPSTFESAAAVGASDVPGLVSVAVVLPIFVIRRRRRRR